MTYSLSGGLILVGYQKLLDLGKYCSNYRWWFRGTIVNMLTRQLLRRSLIRTLFSTKFIERILFFCDICTWLHVGVQIFQSLLEYQCMNRGGVGQFCQFGPKLVIIGTVL